MHEDGSHAKSVADFGNRVRPKTSTLFPYRIPSNPRFDIFNTTAIRVDDLACPKAQRFLQLEPFCYRLAKPVVLSLLS